MFKSNCRYAHGCTIYDTALICWVVSACVLVGNTLIEANCWAGGLDAVLAIPGAQQLEGGAEVGLRVGTCLGYAIIVLALLWFDKTEKLGIFLGIVMLGMVTLFLIVVLKMGIDFERYDPALTNSSLAVVLKCAVSSSDRILCQIICNRSCLYRILTYQLNSLLKT